MVVRSHMFWDPYHDPSVDARDLPASKSEEGNDSGGSTWNKWSEGREDCGETEEVGEGGETLFAVVGGGR
jgi:hypothetical protein